jgi:pyruvate kinase
MNHIPHSLRQTKIVCTIGPASADEGTIVRLVQAGMDVARLNMSHGTHDAHGRALAHIRRAADALGRTTAILLDLQGPKMRIGALEGGGPVQLVAGAEVEITTRPVAGSGQRLSTPHAELLRLVRPGGRILLADGQIELRVEAVADDGVRCRVVNGGYLFERQGIAVPGATPTGPPLSEKDLADLAWGLAQGVDFVAASFVRGPEDVEAVRAAVRRAGHSVPVVAKIEKAAALSRLAAILDVADAVMVARGDLGVELAPEEVPVWQKRIIAAANARRVPVITATQMLESMVRNPVPTRAEATDVANAIWDGTDALMLSAETAAGSYPVEAVAVMDRIARTAERERAYLRPAPPEAERPDFARAVGLAARAVSGALHDVAAIVAFTRDGATARLVAADRPAVPVLALTEDPAVCRRLALVWGVVPVLGRADGTLGELLREAERAARTTGAAAPGEAVLVLGHLPPEAPGSTNFLTLHRVGTAPPVVPGG